MSAGNVYRRATDDAPRDDSLETLRDVVAVLGHLLDFVDEVGPVSDEPGAAGVDHRGAADGSDRVDVAVAEHLAASPELSLRTPGRHIIPFWLPKLKVS